ncbi:cell wall metabolism sensor histidine kinase WalK [Bacillus sp. JCM 19034]|uniref:sensor histidine kinase n=1 Tax=Bacillus sp. JCM 19034 TaxID=1481928 RepID=UPI000781DAA4|nr:HAMP domain-containing sensor histidine kinase [Bacillus sp. JCM 19034]
MRLSTRISWFTSGWLIILLLFVNTGIYFLFEYRTKEAELVRVSQQIQLIAEVVQHTRSESIDQAELLTSYLPSSGMIRIIRNDNRVALTTTKHRELSQLPVEYTTIQSVSQVRFSGHRIAVATLPIIWNDGSVVTIEYSEYMHTFESTLATLRIVLLIASIIVIIPAIIASRLLSQFLIKPIQSLIQTMEKIRMKGSFVRIKGTDHPQDELDQMGQTFNQMINLLEENYQKQEQFVSDASHELKTPLTVIESYARLLKRWGMSDPDRLKEGLDAIYEESQRMKSLTEQMLLLAKGEQEATFKQRESVPIIDITETVAQKLRMVYQRTISVNSEDEFYVNSSEDDIKQLMFILIENGLKYSEEQIDVRFEKSVTEKHVKILIRDFGIGIAKEDQESIFERFVRVDKARSRQTGGSGLGLAIAKAIVLRHDGTIKVDSEEGEGATFIVELPLIKSRVKGEQID